MLNISSSTLRQWESSGLTCPSRTISGYRGYTRDDIEQLKRIQHLRAEMNLNVAAIRHLLFPKRKSERTARRGHPASTEIGRRLRRLRRDRGLTLSAAALGTGLSASFLSCLERAQAHASIATLQKLSVFYDSNVLSFFGGPKQAGKLVRPNERKQLSPEPGVEMELLTRGQTAMEPHLFRLSPGSSSGGSYHHEGEEFIFVIHGNCEIWLDELEHYRLSEGDSLYFSSSQTHRWSNPSSEETILLWINTPPTF